MFLDHLCVMYRALAADFKKLGGKY